MCVCVNILNIWSVAHEVLTAPERACIALVGVQPGFSAECSVLAGTATTLPAEKFWQPGPSFLSRMAHPTNSPAQDLQNLCVRLCALMHGAYGSILQQCHIATPSTTLGQHSVQYASYCHNNLLICIGTIDLCGCTEQKCHLAAANYCNCITCLQ